MMIKRRALGLILTLALVLSLFSFMGTGASAATAGTYDPVAAVAYAAANWNKNEEQWCAEFVWNCVKAGGLQLSTSGLWESFRVTTGCAQGICNALGRTYSGVKYFDPLNLDSEGYARSYHNPKLNAGDVVFQYCTTCGLTPHVMICSGFNEWGAAKFYGHNPPTNDYFVSLSWSGLHKKSSCNVVAKYIDMPNTNPGESNTTNPGEEDDCVCADFVDVSTSAWYHEDVDYMLEHGYMNGVSGTQFSPQGTTTRAMLATVLYRIAGEPDVTGLSNNFNDVVRDSWYEDAVIWASNEGIMIGMGDGKFCPDNNLTREQLMLTLYRYAINNGVAADLTIGAERWELLADRGKVSSWALEGVEWGVHCGMMMGDNNFRINPQDTATRAEFCALIHRYLEDVC